MCYWRYYLFVDVVSLVGLRCLRVVWYGCVFWFLVWFVLGDVVGVLGCWLVA